MIISDIFKLGDGFNLRRVFLRGGNWNETSNTGAFTLNLNWTTSDSNNNVGLRCASDRQNEWYISTDLYTGFKRSQSYLRQRPLAFENTKPLSLFFNKVEGRANG